MSLHKTVRQLVTDNPALSTAELFQQVQPLFPNDNPSWLKQHIANYRCRVLKLIKENPQYGKQAK